MTDVPLARAMLTWSPKADGGGAAVAAHPEDAAASGRHSRSAGACGAHLAPVLPPHITWQDMTDAERVATLLLHAWEAVACDGVEVPDMDAALRSVPELRAAFRRNAEGSAHGAR